MGFKEWIKSEGVHGERRAQAAINLLTINATGLMSGQFKFDLVAGTLTYMKDEVPISHLGDVAFTTEIPEKRMTATRVVAGAVLFGPVGAVIGALARKQTNAAGWLLIDVLDKPEPDGGVRTQWLLEVKKGKSADANKLVNELQNAKRRAIAQSQATVDPGAPGEDS